MQHRQWQRWGMIGLLALALAGLAWAPIGGRAGALALPVGAPVAQAAANLPQVSAGDSHTCVINEAGQLYCWG
ncbi:RCC1 domain-containing protein, partial [uncultured Chloroflexus sp.]|uniref:RCC1-like domain-containing protein n=1 Tax=uncultured Chloroflexus sp. TaxID=214040 RepID=UPI00261C0AD1